MGGGGGGEGFERKQKKGEKGRGRWGGGGLPRELLLCETREYPPLPPPLQETVTKNNTGVYGDSWSLW